VAALRDALALTLDSDPAVESHGLRLAARWLSAAARGSGGGGLAPAPAPAHVLPLVDAALRGANSPDAAVGAAAIEVLRAAASCAPRAALPPLILRFVDEAARPGARARVGEALCRFLRGARRGGVGAAFAPPLLGAAMRVGVGGWRRFEALGDAVAGGGGAGVGAGAAGAAAAAAAGVRAGVGVGAGAGSAVGITVNAPSIDDPAARTARAYNALVELEALALVRCSALSMLGDAVGAMPLGGAGSAHAADILMGLASVLRERGRSEYGERAQRAAALERVLERWPRGWFFFRRTYGCRLTPSLPPKSFPCAIFYNNARPLAPSPGGGEAADTQHADARVAALAADVRRAAGFAAQALLATPGAVDALVRSGLMRDFYAALHAARARDPDARVRAHAQDALAAVDEALLSGLPGGGGECARERPGANRARDTRCGKDLLLPPRPSSNPFPHQPLRLTRATRRQQRQWRRRRVSPAREPLRSLGPQTSSEARRCRGECVGMMRAAHTSGSAAY
jgi:hypothetical protein